MSHGGPRSLDAERAVLGGLMLDGDRIDDVADVVSAEDFSWDPHRRLFQLLVELRERGAPTELVAVSAEVARRGDPEEYGGLDYIASLPDEVASTANLEYYARIVHERAVARRLAEAAREVHERALAGEDELDDLLERAEQAIFAVTQQGTGGEWRQLSEVLDEEVHRIEQMLEQDRAVTGTTTGFVDLDRVLGGLQASDLVVLAARPGMGKTAFALNVARNAAEAGHGVAVFSLEMDRGQLAMRLMCAEARVDLGRARTGRIRADTELPALAEAAEHLYRLPLFIDDTPALTVGQIRSRARRLKSRHPQLALVVVDYIGLVHGDPRVSREQQVAAASRGLKALAKELGVTVLALSQLNRGVEHRTDRRPILSDLRESGAIEQDADVILFIYRDEYYREDSPDRGVAEVIVAKHRNGPTGKVRLAFIHELTLFQNLAERPGDEGYIE